MPSVFSQITATEIGEYVRHRSCERRFKLDVHGRQEAKRLPFAERLFNALDPVLQEEGKRREGEWETSLLKDSFADVISAALRTSGVEASWGDLVAGFESLKQQESGYGREIVVEADLGVFRVKGRIDFCLIRWIGSQPKLRLVECKASRRDRTYQRIQVALYGMVVRQLLSENPITVAGISVGPNDVECVVARIDESTNESQAILGLDAFDLSQEESDLRRLLASEGALARIIATPLDELDYQLDAKCDGCVFNVHCYPESARQRRIQLIGAEPSIIRALESVGIRTIDDLADLDLDGHAAQAARGLPGFNQSLTQLQRRAHARRSTLPGGRDPETYEVEALPNFPQSQLPEHEISGQRLVRVYLSVHYDYVENRVGALAAHLTASDGKLHTAFVLQNGRWTAGNSVVERRESGRDENNRPEFVESPVQGSDIIRYKASPWTGRYAEDTGAEREILQGFFQELVDAVAEVARTDRAPIHFYVWSRSEMAQLVEACSRVGSGLLGHLRELLGCREPLEQLIYSCLEDEVHNRYALGWTGRGLVVATSLAWYGRRFLWRRVVNGVEVDLDHAFTQDIFDFKTELWLNSRNEWSEARASEAQVHKFEIRSRFHDTLTAPYWRALWSTLPDPSTMPATKQKIANAIRRYKEAGERGRFRSYLRARTHALRWVDEGIRFKNHEISKPLLDIGNLIQFSLNIDSTAEAAIDFLRLDHHVAVTDWLARHLVPPAYRAPTGRTLPIANVESLGHGKLTARIDLTGYDISQQALQNQCTIGEGSFVRMTPARPDPRDGQTLNQLLRLGSTCVIDEMDWDSGEIKLSVLPRPTSTLYVLQSYGYSQPGFVCDRATLDESPSDFVKGRVEQRLRALGGHHACDWLNPLDPQVPVQRAIAPGKLAKLERVASRVRLPNRRRLAAEQARTVVDGLLTRIQLLQGPPGTGKTTTTAVAILLRILARRHPGDIVLVAANTHAAVNNLLDAIARLREGFSSAARSVGETVPPVRVAKIESSDSSPAPEEVMDILSATAGVKAIRELVTGSVAILGGTTGSLLKLGEKLDATAAYGKRVGGFQVSTLIVDEASMMVFPDFLALATLLDADGEMMLTGDHRQLTPIMAHDWEREDRPPVVLYQPYASAYDAIRNIARTGRMPAESVQATALQHTFRLPAVIRDLIARLYTLDEIVLTGRPASAYSPGTAASTWEKVWQDGGGLFLIVHTEKQSTHSNLVEAAIIENLLNAVWLPANSTAIVTPHRAQRNLLTQRLAAYTGTSKPIGVIDTVEKLQGGERPNIIVSATESDPASIAARVEFILDLNRSNVAFSRSEERLIVICSDALLDHIPAEIEQYESAMLWKSLREYCSELVGSEVVAGHKVKVFTPPLANVIAAAEVNDEGLGVDFDEIAD